MGRNLFGTMPMGLTMGFGIRIGGIAPVILPRHPLPEAHPGPCAFARPLEVGGGGARKPVLTLTPGQKVFYPGYGVVEVIGTEVIRIGGQDLDCFIFKWPQGRLTLPLANVERVGLRPLMTKDKVREVFQFFRERPRGIHQNGGPWTRRLDVLKDHLKTGDPLLAAKIVREFRYLSLKGRELAVEERKLLNKALDLLAAEIAIVRGQPEPSVREEIEGIIAKASR